MSRPTLPTAIEEWAQCCGDVQGILCEVRTRIKTIAKASDELQIDELLIELTEILAARQKEMETTAALMLRTHYGPIH